MIVGLWCSNWESYFISRDIRLGNVSPHLVKPVPFIFSQIGNNIGEKVFKSLFLIPVLILYTLLFHPSFPSLSLLLWLAFIASTLMAAMISFIVDFLLGISAFWLHDSMALRESYSIAHLVLSGRFVPLSVLPLSMQNLSSFLPFRYSLSLPLEIVTSKLPGSRVFFPLLFQLLLLFFFILLYRLLWSRGLKRYSASGN
jgi:ABC-2 type transport system permease protein